MAKKGTDKSNNDLIDEIRSGKTAYDVVAEFIQEVKDEQGLGENQTTHQLLGQYAYVTGVLTSKLSSALSTISDLRAQQDFAKGGYLKGPAESVEQAYDIISYYLSSKPEKTSKQALAKHWGTLEKMVGDTYSGNVSVLVDAFYNMENYAPDGTPIDDFFYKVEAGEYAKGGKIEFGDTVHDPDANKTGMVYEITDDEVIIRTINGLHKFKKSKAEKIDESFAKGGVLSQEDEMWKLIERANWKKDHDYKRIGKSYSRLPEVKFRQLNKFYNSKLDELGKNFNEDWLGEPGIGVSDDGWSDLRAEVIGRGKKFYESITADKLRKMADENDYEENFGYSFHIDDYAKGGVLNQTFSLKELFTK